MNPKRLYELWRLNQRLKEINEEKGSFMDKFGQYLHLALTLSGVIGVPTMASKWLDQPTHAIEFSICVGLSVLLHAICPSIFGGPSADALKASKLGALLLLAVLAPMSVHAQAAADPAAGDVQNLYAGGLSYSVGGSPALAGTGLYAHLLTDSGTYAFTAIDALPNTLKPFVVTTNVGAGIAQRVFTLGGKYPVFVPTAAGISWSGNNTGWQWNGGGLVSIHLKGQYYLMPSIRFLKSSVSNGTGYQPIVGVLFGWGQ